MADAEKKRVVRSKEERKAEIDKKIAYHKECIAALEAQKDSCYNRKQPKIASASWTPAQ